MGDEQPIDHYRRQVSRVVSGRKHLILGGALRGHSSAARLAEMLHQLGAARSFLLAQTRADGDPVPSEQAVGVSLDVETPDFVDAIHAFEERLGELPPDVALAIDRWDPERTARALALILLRDLPQVAGRTRWGDRPASWRALEDKTVVDALWDELDVPRAPSRVVEMQPGEPTAASRALDAGDGTVWAADATRRVHGGASYQRWVRGAEHARDAERFLTGLCERVRVMPYLEGVPCSVEGIVFPERSAVFRPLEMLVLRRPDGRFAYAGMATFWDPSPEDREALRALVRRVGESLRNRYDYRGPYTVDGVLTRDGFLPTELNPRWGAGLNVIANAVPELPLALLALAATEGEELDYRASELEDLVLRRADLQRGVLMRMQGAGRIEERVSVPLARVPREAPSTGTPEERARATWRAAIEDEESDAALILAPRPTGCVFQLAPVLDRTPRGPMLATALAAAAALADRDYGAGLGTLIPARAVR